jgi:hypothetical protein
VVEACHNDAENTRPDMPYIHVGTYCDANKVGNIDAPNSLDCNGVYQIHDEETFDVNVPIQNLAGVGGVDDNLVWSVVKFYTDGAPVLITYVCGDESMAVINAFIIDMPGLQENAWEPEPERDATDVCPADVNFYWTPGIYADDHNVYFGTSMNDVNESAIAYTEHVAANSWTAPELKVDTTYYWRVETVNDVCAPYSWPGTIWSFSTHDGLADDPLPNTRGLPLSAASTLEWTASCFADTQKLYFGVDLPETIVLFEDDFESGAFEPNWAADPNWEVWDANDDPNYEDYEPHDHNLARIVGSSGTLAMNVDVNTIDACSVRVEFNFRKTVEIQDNEIKLYYWNGSLNDYEFIKDLNSLDPNDQWLHYTDDINESQYMISNFKIMLEADISSGGTVYIDNVRMTNTWPWTSKWYKGREDSNSYSISPELQTTYHWRIDTVIDGNTLQGDYWTFSTGLGGVIMWLDFDGALNSDIVPPVSAYTETGKTIEFAKYISGGSVKYGEANPMHNRDGTSAVFDPCAGLYRLDPCAPDGENPDPLRLDGYQYTIEMWVKPTNLSEEDMGSMVLITKGGNAEEDWESGGSWCIIIEEAGDEEDNAFKFRHASTRITMGDDSAVEDEWSHLAVVFNQQHPDPEKRYSIYYNGTFDDSDDYFGLNPTDSNNPVSIGFGLENDGNFANVECFFEGLIDEIRILDIALDLGEFLLTPGPEWASAPNPGNLAVGVDPCDPNVVLSWTPGIYADTHKVYFSTDFTDVNTGNPVALLPGSPYDTNEANDISLEFGKVYYWRVDEVNDTCSPNLWEGVVWKFTTEFVIEDVDQILRYRFDEDSGDNVVDSSGYGKHGLIEGGRATANWGPTDGKYVGCLKFDDDTSVKVPAEGPKDTLNSITDKVSISVWLYGIKRDTGNNWVLQAGGGDYSLGVRVPDVNGHVYFRAGNDTNDVVKWEAGSSTVKAWRDNWHHFVFIKDEAEDKMSIYFDGELKWWKEDTTSSLPLSVYNRNFRVGAETHEDDDYEGWMDDLRIYKKALTDVNVLKLFRGGDLDVAWAPSPYDGQPDAPWDANLVWKPGDDANSHKVFFGTSWEDVNAMTEPCSVQDACEYEPGPLVLDKYYYWRIDEVNDGPPAHPNSPWRGPIWSFKVADYAAVDDFESYDKTTNQIKDTWRDYWYQAMNPPYIATGGVLDLGVYPYNIVYAGGGGSQSMLYQFKNILWGTPGRPDAYAGVCYSEVSLPLPDELQDWTASGVEILRLYFYGDVDNNDVNATMYVGVKDGGNPSKYAEIRYGEYDPNNEDTNDVNEPEWHRWDIGLPHFNDSNFAAVANDVDLTNIAELLIGFGDKRSPVCGGEGIVIFDDIRLQMPICKPEFGPLADFSGNCIVDMADVGIMGEAWLRRDANYSPGEMQEPNDANLVGWWRLDDDACDSSIYDHNSIIAGDYKWVTGHNDVNVDDLAVEFGSKGGRILVPDDNNTPALRPKYKVSVSAWVYFTENQDSARVVVKGHNDKETYSIEIDDTDEFSFMVRDANNLDEDEDYTRHDVNAPVWTDDWIHLAGTFDGDTNTIKCYVNGRLMDSKDDANDPNFLLSQDVNGLAIGSKAEGLDNEFEGTIDDVRVYDYGLSEAEVRWLATDGTGYAPLTTPINLYDKEKPGEQAINFKDFAMLLEDWMEEALWP